MSLLSAGCLWRNVHLLETCFLRRASHAVQARDETLPVPPSLLHLETKQDMTSAKEWLSRFKAQSIPKSLVEITFSRSSGPGGQNVNKVNTKATLRCPVKAPWIPLWAQDTLRKSPHYAASSQSVLIISTLHRSQPQNVEDCLSKLHVLIQSASSAALKNEPTEQQKERVRQLERAEKAKRRIEKDKRSHTKRTRSKRDWD